MAAKRNRAEIKVYGVAPPGEEMWYSTTNSVLFDEVRVGRTRAEVSAGPAPSD